MFSSWPRPGRRSTDGLEFSKPDLGQTRLEGTAAAGLANNAIAGLSGATQREGTSVWVDPKRSLGAKYVSQAKVFATPVFKNTTVGNISVAGMIVFSVSDDGKVWRDAEFVGTEGPPRRGGHV